jgi:hypothetical protein
MVITFEALASVEVIGEGLGVDESAAVALEDHIELGGRGRKRKRGGVRDGNPLRALECGQSRWSVCVD